MTRAVSIDREALEGAVRTALAAIGENPDRPELARTAARVAGKVHDLLGGIGSDPAQALTEGRFAVARRSVNGDAKHALESELLAFAGIPFRSFCEHDLLPFDGHIDLVIHPGEWRVGFGRVYDAVTTCTNRLSLQEDLGWQLADTFRDGLAAAGVLVRIAARHGCVELRGGKRQVGDIVTCAAHGTLAAGEGRAAALALLNAESVSTSRSVATVRARPAIRVAPRVREDADAALPLDMHVMGILNVTPDSFSDGGRFEAASEDERTARAVAAAEALVSAGATIIDVGGESTRPGAHRVDEADELARVIPVVTALGAHGIAVSVDTMRASVAEASMAAGARFINDVSGGRADSRMLDVAAATDAPFILSHWRGHSSEMTSLAHYRDAAREIHAELLGMRDAAVARGLDPARIILDPGLGFAKDAEHDWAVLANLDDFLADGHPLLIGASRKRFMGGTLPDGAPVADRDLPTAVLSSQLYGRGVWGVRVHNVGATVAALTVARRMRDER